MLFRGGVDLGLRLGLVRDGTVHCPGDRQVYLDLSFFQEMVTASRPPATSRAYVIAHEVGTTSRTSSA